MAGLTLAAGLFSAVAQAAGGHAPESYVIEVPVVDVNPMIEIVEVSTPREVCWNERVQHRVDDGPRGPRTSTIVGTVLGAAIGNTTGRNSPATTPFL
jgi:uncharacterized protein YcfJ